MYAAPCVEGPGGYGFLNEDPLVLMKEGRIPNKVPLFAGFTSGEGYVYFICKARSSSSPSVLCDF